MTVNELLALSNILKGRLNELQKLRYKVSTIDHFYGSVEKEVEPTYDVKKVDKKIIEIKNFLFRTTTKIKESNAVTQVEINVDVDSLLSPLE